MARDLVVLLLVVILLVILLRAIEVLRRNGESRRKLVGADAPARVEVSDKLTTEIERLAADLDVSV